MQYTQNNKLHKFHLLDTTYPKSSFDPMKKTTYFSIITLFLMFITSCGKETQASTKGGGIFKVRLTIDPPLQPGKSVIETYNYLTMSIANSSKGWGGINQTKPLTTLETDQISVTSGQNIMFTILFSNAFDSQCRTIKCEAIQNGKTNEIIYLSMGTVKNGNSPCEDGLNITKNFIMK